MPAAATARAARLRRTVAKRRLPGDTGCVRWLSLFVVTGTARLSPLIALALLAVSTVAWTQDLGEDLVIETEHGALRESRRPPRVEVLIDAVIPAGETPIDVRVREVALQDVEEVKVEVDGREVARLTSPPFVVVHDFGREARRHQVVATARLVGGRILEGSRITQTPGSNLVTTVDLVEVSVIVKDREGNRVLDLARDDFTVLEDGVVQGLKEFTRERTPLTLVLVLDSSGSMEGRMWSLKKSAIDFVRKVDADVPIQVIDFDHEVRLQQEFTLDRDAVVAAINRLDEGGGTHLWDAAYSGAFALEGKESRRAVVLFTDGVDQSGDDDEERLVSGLDEVIEMARQERIQFYGIGFGRKIDGATLGRLSEETGGVFYEARSTKDFRLIYDAILADVAAQYVLTYGPTNARHDGTFRKIEVRVSRPEVVAYHRKGYRAPEN